LFARNELPAVWHDLARRLMPEYIDQPRGLTRMATFRPGRLDGCIFVGPAQAPPQWDVVRTLFESGALTERERRILLSGRSGDGMVETGL
jgi:assimilatory nitrate reductase catalytic subunit